jgi:tRNA-modifying protein YgfZ
MANSAILAGRAIVAVAGADARDFLQGLTTNDIGQCTPKQPIYTALLTPQGKILFEFFVVTQHNDELLLDCAAAAAPDLIKRFGFYRLRAKVQIVRRPELSVAAVWGEPLPNIEAIPPYRDPRLPALGIRLVGSPPQLDSVINSISPGDYDSFRVALGIPDSADLPPDQIFALDTGLEDLNGVSFSKGCYVGQEVTARMKHRATARRRFYIAEAALLPPAGTVIQSNGRELGRMATGKNGRGLALVRLDRLAEAEAARTAIEANGKPIVLHKPDWLHA